MQMTILPQSLYLILFHFTSLLFFFLDHLCSTSFISFFRLTLFNFTSSDDFIYSTCLHFISLCCLCLFFFVFHRLVDLFFFKLSFTAGFIWEHFSTTFYCFYFISPSLDNRCFGLLYCSSLQCFISLYFTALPCFIKYILQFHFLLCVLNSYVLYVLFDPYLNAWPYFISVRFTALFSFNVLHCIWFIEPLLFYFNQQLRLR